MKRENKIGKPCQHESKSVMECIHARRSVRNFRPDPIPEKVIRQILEAGRFAPCPGGVERWRFGVIRDQ
ncbi:MAG: nitroreductase family protein, partial [Armatimonadetes bacterium]|nr:nitroreductase family protein [Candidatus Latescibacterota bacterium]NIO76789.1 nitroreductase family protein [Armatimonadota bacterium]NIO78669.1 nitroreductase family protein [Candidatus Latescibacterota bacterium]